MQKLRKESAFLIPKNQKQLSKSFGELDKFLLVSQGVDDEDVFREAVLALEASSGLGNLGSPEATGEIWAPLEGSTSPRGGRRGECAHACMQVRILTM